MCLAPFFRYFIFGVVFSTASPRLLAENCDKQLRAAALERVKLTTEDTFVVGMPFEEGIRHTIKSPSVKSRVMARFWIFRKHFDSDPRQVVLAEFVVAIDHGIQFALVRAKNRGLSTHLDHELQELLLLAHLSGNQHFAARMSEKISKTFDPEQLVDAEGEVSIEKMLREAWLRVTKEFEQDTSLFLVEADQFVEDMPTNEFLDGDADGV